MTDTPAQAPAPKKKKSQGSFKGEFYRQMRLWHGYLSAFAFVALMFFSLTGLFLNHPEWFKAEVKDQPSHTVTLTPAELAAVQADKEPGKALVTAVAKKTRIVGAYSSGEVIDTDIMSRAVGPKGASNLVADTKTGKVEVTLEKRDFVTVINELHRGKDAPVAWKLVIDLTAVVVLALSLLGYILFFSLRFRLKTSLILTGVSIVVLAGVFLFLTP
jgi:hypothetical protein